MITMRRAVERGTSNLGWLDSRHTFSFAEYYDPAHMGFGPLRVINDDRVAAGRGFGTHPHRDMEIISYVIEGAIEHKDSMGNGSVVSPGDVQRMSAGTGVLHSEFNPSKTEPVHFLQIWIQPAAAGLPPSYEQKSFSERERQGTFRIVASSDGRQGSVTVHQDMSLHSALFSAGDQALLELGLDRRAWIQVVRGEVVVNGARLGAGDGAAVENERRLEVTASSAAEVLVFDLP
ncbi:MAG TPA: pirin family protein [Polyangiaceae bacterium]|nr:pirin family protein [Polyangiaceae bacterium]